MCAAPPSPGAPWLIIAAANEEVGSGRPKKRPQMWVFQPGLSSAQQLEMLTNPLQKRPKGQFCPPFFFFNNSSRDQIGNLIKVIPVEVVVTFPGR